MTDDELMELAAKAYATPGIVPVEKKWQEQLPFAACGLCLMAAIVYAKTGKKPFEYERPRYCDMAREQLNKNHHWIVGAIEGFDGERSYELSPFMAAEIREQRQAGRDFGRKAREKFLGNIQTTESAQ